MFFDEQPVFFFLLWRAHSYQAPATRQFFAFQPELEPAFAVSCERIAIGNPDSFIPDQHAAGTVLIRRAFTFEGSIGERMVFDVHSEPLVAWIETRSFWNGPAFQRPVEL